MFEKLNLTDKECDNIIKGVMYGVGIGILIGALVSKVAFFFAAGGVIGIVFSLAYSVFARGKKLKKIN